MLFFDKLNEISCSPGNKLFPQQKLTSMLQTLLSNLSVDCAWLAYPCDPDLSDFNIPLQVNDPDQNSAAAVFTLPPSNSPLMIRLMSASHGSEQPVCIEQQHQALDELRNHAVQALMAIALEPANDRPWLLGIHHCSTRVWARQEIRLFDYFAGKMLDTLSNHLLLSELEQQKDQYHTLFEFSHDALAIFNLKGNLLEANQAYCALSGYTVDELKGLASSENVHGLAISFYNDFVKAMQYGEIFRCETINHHKNGKRHEVEVYGASVQFQGQTVGLIRLRNVTEHRTHEREQEKALSIQKGILEATADGILVVDTKLNVIKYNHKFAEISNIPTEVLHSRNSRRYFLSVSARMENSEKFKDQVNSIYADPSKTISDVIYLLDGKVIEFYSQSFVIDNEPHGRVWSFRDITDAFKLTEQLNYQASHDPLTGLINRREFERRLNHVLNVEEYNNGTHVLCYMDLDQFKLVNDSCGHIAGDELLKQVTRLMLSLTRKEDALGRLGGDEFGLLLQQCDLQQAERVVQMIRQVIADYIFCWQQQQFNISVSIGMVLINKPRMAVEKLLVQADTACYAAKTTGRNRIHIHHPEDKVIGRHYSELDRLNQIQQALHQNHFQLWAQPIVALNGIEKGEHLEILLRMTQKNKQNLMPGIFLPIAERHNLASRIDHWVICHVLRWFSGNSQKLENINLVTINLSGQSLGDQNLLQFIEQAIFETGFPKHKLCFEITETATVNNISEAKHFIDTLKNIGCSFALDDFGSGFSSFAYLKNLPIDFLKIDGQFVRDMAIDPIDYAMVKSINDVGRVMGKKTIAEFVESKEILYLLEDMGVDYAQGYFLGEPMLLQQAVA